MIAQNIAHQAVLAGHSVLSASAGQLLGDPAGLDSASAPRQRLRRYAAPTLHEMDEVGTSLTRTGMPISSSNSSTAAMRRRAA